MADLYSRGAANKWTPYKTVLPAMGLLGPSEPQEKLGTAAAMLSLISGLSPTQFENLVYDLIVCTGGQNSCWRTPGADGGRDIETTFSRIDVSGASVSERWYIECKRYSSSLDWPTVWQKIAFAESRGADFLLVVTNSNPSPGCESEIVNWNLAKAAPKVRFWRGYELERIVANFPQVGAKYGLLNSTQPLVNFHPIVELVMKTSQAAYMADAFGLSSKGALEACSSLSELVWLRTSQLRAEGAFYTGPVTHDWPEYEWLTAQGPLPKCAEEGLRAIICYLRFACGAEWIEAECSAKVLRLAVKGAKSSPLLIESSLKDICILADFDILDIDSGSLTLGER